MLTKIKNIKFYRLSYNGASVASDVSALLHITVLSVTAYNSINKLTVINFTLLFYCVIHSQCGKNMARKVLHSKYSVVRTLSEQVRDFVTVNLQ
jgi:hypothetical protein